MTNTQRLAIVRQALLAWMQSQHDGDDAEISSESLLMVDGFFRGRRFVTDDYLATWFLEEDELKIHSSADGSLLCVLDADEITSNAQADPQIISMPRPVTNDDSDDQQDEVRRAA